MTEDGHMLLFGGTFDPPHLAHVQLPPFAAPQLGCSQIVYIPASVNPLKTDEPPTPAEHRAAMVELAVRAVPGASVSRIELERGGPSWFIDTVRAIRRASPGVTLYFLIGADQALCFHRWREWREILALATPAVLLRPPMTLAAFSDELGERYDAQEAEWWLDRIVQTPPVDVSATDVRRKLIAGETVDDVVPVPVLEYIREHGLYRA